MHPPRLAVLFLHMHSNWFTVIACFVEETTTFPNRFDQYSRQCGLQSTIEISAESERLECPVAFYAILLSEFT